MTVTLRRNDQGLIPAIVQHHETGETLMMAYVSAESLARTMQDGEAWFYSRSRQALWHKGEESGAFLRVKALHADCDGDTLLMRVDPAGPACHTGAVSCFFTPLEDAPVYAEAPPGAGVLEELFAVIKARQAASSPESYTARLLAEGVGRVAQKVVEEAGETAIAAVQDDKPALVGETADLLYHTLTLLAAAGVSPNDVWAELARRRR